MPLALNHPRCQIPDEERGTAEIIETIQSQTRPGVYPASLFPSHMCMLSRFRHVQLFATLWTAARQAPLCMRFSRQGYQSGLPFLPPGDLPDPGVEPTSLTSPALAGGSLPLAPLHGNPNKGSRPCLLLTPAHVALPHGACMACTAFSQEF